MMELIALAAKMMPLDELINELEKGIVTYKENGDDSKLAIYSVMVCMNLVFKGDSNVDVMKKVTEITENNKIASQFNKKS